MFDNPLSFVSMIPLTTELVVPLDVVIIAIRFSLNGASIGPEYDSASFLTWDLKIYLFRFFCSLGG